MSNKLRAAGMLSLLLIAGAALAAKELELVDADANGVVLQGYDPVAYFTGDTAVKGNDKYQATYRGGTYYFASAANRKLFKRDPAKYAPQYGGYCAMAVAMGRLEDADPKMFVIHNSRLLVQHNEKAQAMFMSNPDGFHHKADEQWPALLEKNGR